MKRRTYINELSSHVGSEVTLYAWIDTIRKHGGIQFVLLRDISGIVQAIVLKSQGDIFQQVKQLVPETVVKTTGTVKEESQASDGYELALTFIQVLSEPELTPAIPIRNEGENTASTSNRFDFRWLNLRNPEQAKIFKVWTELEKGLRSFFDLHKFVQIYTPSLMNTASESGAEVFEVAYFENKAYLAQSPQFYKQMAMASGMERVFVTGPVFRAEPSFTTRHMTEFTGFDFEISYINSHFDVMEAEEELLLNGLKQLKESQLIDLELPSLPFPKISFEQAKALLSRHNIPSKNEHDFSPDEERALSAIIKEQTGHDFVFIIDYPVDARPFYHMRHEDNDGLTKSFDLLFKGVEISTGAQREHRVDILEKQALEKSIPIESITNYLDFFRYGCPPHGGVGLGPGRIVMKLMDLSSVKEATFLPRDVKRLTP